MAGKRKYRTESQGLETVVKKNGFLSARRDAIQNRAYEMYNLYGTIRRVLFEGKRTERADMLGELIRQQGGNIGGKADPESPDELQELTKQLAGIRYVPSKFEVFAVYEPKRRMVHAPAFVDKVVLHALVDNILYDALTKSFIRDSHASQTGKGTDDGLMRLKTHMVDYYRREGHGADGWVLKGDVRHFFASIDHRKLKRKLKAVLDKRGVDPRVYELLCIYIDVMEDGLPLGYQTSQLFALMFLDEFDHIIKEKYRIKYYGRYMDDFYIICSDKKKLQCILRDVRALMDSYGLELNQKTAIFPLRNGIDFLGFHSYLTDTGAVIQKLRRDSSKRMKNKIRYWETAYPAGEVTKQEILRSFDAWDAHAAHGDTYSLRRKYADRLEKLLDCKIPIHRKINSNKLARDRRRARQCRCIYKKQHKALSLSVSQNTRPAEIMPWA